MRSSRVHKKRNRKLFISKMLLAFFVIIPAAAVISALAIYFTVMKYNNNDAPAAAFLPEGKASEATEYNFNINAKQFYRIEIKKFEEYEAAEAQIALLKNKKLNGFIVKEQGYVTAFGLFVNQSQADTSAKYLKRKGVESTFKPIDISEIDIKYHVIDKNLIDLLSAVDAAAMKILNEKSALSLESLYSDKLMEGEDLALIVEQETKLIKYLNYLQSIKTSEVNAVYKENLESLIKELLVDKLQADSSYNYYGLQKSLMNQAEAIEEFYLNK